MNFKDTHYGDLTNQKINNNYIDVSSNKIKLLSLEGSPKEINGSFDCSFNKINSLKYSPEVVIGEFNRSGNNITSLEHMPKKVTGNFSVSSNKIKNFLGFYNNDYNNFYIFSNGLRSLKGLPEEVNIKFLDCSYNHLKDLSGGVKQINGDFLCMFNNLKSLKGSLKQINGTFNCSFNKSLKNVKRQIVENQIIAKKYITDEGDFTFEEIKHLFKNKKIKSDYGICLY